jgi:hypothetical protein
MELNTGAQNYVKSNFGRASNIKLNEMTMDRLEGICKGIHEITPEAFSDLYQTQRDPRSQVHVATPPEIVLTHQP